MQYREVFNLWLVVHFINFSQGLQLQRSESITDEMPYLRSVLQAVWRISKIESNEVIEMAFRRTVLKVINMI